MTYDDAHAKAAHILGAGIRVRFFQGRNGTWWACATLSGVLDPLGNEYDWAERLGFLTHVTVETFARETLRQFRSVGAIAPEPKVEAPATA